MVQRLQQQILTEETTHSDSCQDLGEAFRNVVRGRCTLNISDSLFPGYNSRDWHRSANFSGELGSRWDSRTLISPHSVDNLTVIGSAALVAPATAGSTNSARTISAHLLTFGEQPLSVVTLERRYGPRRLRDDDDLPRPNLNKESNTLSTHTHTPSGIQTRKQCIRMQQDASFRDKNLKKISSSRRQLRLLDPQAFNIWLCLHTF